MHDGGIPGGSLAPPDGLAAADRALEIVRVWIVSDHQEFVIRPRVWKDPAAWGILLADLMRHIAQATVEHEGKDLHAVLARIREGLEAELAVPTDEDGVM